MHLLRFAGNRPKLPRGMAETEILARFKDANAHKLEWVTHHEEAYRFSLPHRNTWFDQTKGQKKNRDIFDSTAVLGVPAFATKLQSIMVPPWRDWSMLQLGPSIPAEIRNASRMKILMAEQTDIMFSHIHHSNMATQVHEAFQDLAIGTGAFDLMAGRLGHKALMFNSIPLTELSIEEGPQSTIETTYRELGVPGRLIGRQWPGAEIPPDLERLIKDSPGKDIAFVEAVLFDPDRGVWEGAAIWKEKKITIWRAMWETNPRIVFRWSVTPGERFGRGPIMQVLPDIKTANKVVEFILRNAAIQVAGMWTAESDSAINAFTFRPAPGIVIPVRSNSTANPTIRALERTGSLEIGFEVLTRLQDTINRALFQHLREPSDSVITATQFAIENRELVNQIGSSFGRLQTEVVEATTKRSVDILLRRGAMANVRIDGQNVTLKHTSPLARAQDMDDLETLRLTLESAPEESIAMGIKIEDLGAWVAEKTGLDPRLIRDEAERAQIAQQASEVIAAGEQVAA